MSHRPVRFLIEDILERIQRIERAVAGMEREGFLHNETRRPPTRWSGTSR
jgi:uncharacterized protein with HEPN domain